MANKDEELRRLVSDLVGPLAAEHGLEVLDVKVSGPANRRLVRITADVIVALPARADRDLPPGIDVDVVATLSRELGELLDERDTGPGSYTLEVTSPGVSAPLSDAQAFARNLGRRVRVELVEAGGSITGELREVTDEAVVLAADDGERTCVLAEIDHGTVLLPW